MTLSKTMCSEILGSLLLVSVVSLVLIDSPFSTWLVQNCHKISSFVDKFIIELVQLFIVYSVLQGWGWF